MDMSVIMGMGMLMVPSVSNVHKNLLFHLGRMADDHHQRLLMSGSAYPFSGKLRSPYRGYWLEKIRKTEKIKKIIPLWGL